MLFLHENFNIMYFIDVNELLFTDTAVLGTGRFKYSSLLNTKQDFKQSLTVLGTYWRNSLNTLLKNFVTDLNFMCNTRQK